MVTHASLPSCQGLALASTSFLADKLVDAMPSHGMTIEFELRSEGGVTTESGVTMTGKRTATSSSPQNRK
jgi:hypothetical protein